jgi:hypothetical protein
MLPHQSLLPFIVIFQSPCVDFSDGISRHFEVLGCFDRRIPESSMMYLSKCLAPILRKCNSKDQKFQQVISTQMESLQVNEPKLFGFGSVYLSFWIDLLNYSNLFKGNQADFKPPPLIDI